MSELVDVPTSSCAAQVTMSIMRTVGRSTSPFTLETQSFRWPGEQWMIDFNLPPIINKEVANEWKAFAVKLRGSFNYFLMGDPSAKLPLGVATGTPQVASSNQTGNLLQTKGWTASVVGIMKAGDYIQLGTGVNSRLHMITADVNSDAGGLANLPLEPALRSSPALNQAVIVNNARGVFRLQDNTYSWNVTPGPRYQLGFTAVEVINA